MRFAHRTSPLGPLAAGFALLEVLLALAILAFISATIWGTFSRTYAAKRRLEAAQDRVHTVRVALMRMTREIEMAYLSNHENQLVQERRTTFMSAPTRGISELRFAWFGKPRYRADSPEGDTSVVMYYGAPDPEQAGVVNLMRRETRRLQALDPMTLPGDAYILCPDVSSVNFSFYDARLKEWRDSWNTTGADGVDYLPTHVRISLVVIDERGKEVVYASAARIQMSEKVQHMRRL
jgi:general secretion pathway protein J